MKSRFFGRGVSKRALLASTAFGLAACSGGGGGGSSSPPAPPNAAPTAVVIVDNSSPDEGQPFIIDASGSTDADGDALMITIAQTNGPDAGPPPADLVVPAVQGVQGFSAPEVSVDEEMIFEITVSDGEDSVALSVTITAVNVIREPIAAGFVIGTELKVEHAPTALLASKDSFTPDVFRIFGLKGTDRGSTALFILETRPDGVFRDEIVVPTPEFPNPAGKFGVFTDFFRFERRPTVVFFDEVQQLISIYAGLDVEPTEYRFAGMEQLDSKPCAATSWPTEVGFTISQALIVGTRGDGIIQLEGEPNEAIKTFMFDSSESLIAGGEYCSLWLYQLRSFGGGEPSLFDVLAIDHSSKQYVILDSQADGSFETIGPVPLQDAEDITIFSADRGDWRGFAVAYEHSAQPGDFLTQVYLQDQDPITGDDLDTFTLIDTLDAAIGEPSYMLMADILGDFADEVVVFSDQSPYLAIFEGQLNDTATTQSFLSPSYIEIGLGATQALDVDNRAFSLDKDIYVSFLSKNKIIHIVNNRNAVSPPG